MRLRNRQIVWILLAISLLALGFVMQKHLTQDSKLQSLVVLPFVNAGGDPEMEYLSDGITVSALDLAYVHMGLGHQEEAMDFLEKAYEERAGFLETLNANPIFDDLRSHPRFQNLLSKLHFPPQ